MLVAVPVPVAVLFAPAPPVGDRPDTGAVAPEAEDPGAVLEELEDELEPDAAEDDVDAPPEEVPPEEPPEDPLAELPPELPPDEPVAWIGVLNVRASAETAKKAHDFFILNLLICLNDKRGNQGIVQIGSDLIQSLFQISDQVVGVFDADRQADDIGPDAKRDFLFVG